ncbi:MAG TPA: hypothetical protein VGD78_07890, partial [Chthoniobacterales bacterium]
MGDARHNHLRDRLERRERSAGALACQYPDRITALISQNGNAYIEGLSEGWNPIQAYWKEPSEAHRTALRA